VKIVKPKHIVIDGSSLTVEQVDAIARGGTFVEIAPKAMKAVEENRRLLDKLVVTGTPIYGVTTGIGELARVQLSPEVGEELQKRIVYSHSAATGKVIPEGNARAALLLRINTLIKGYSGVRPVLVELMLNMLNRGVTPEIYEKGSLGVSGDLSPLSMIGEVIMGEGHAYYKGRRYIGGMALRKAGLKPLTLSYKEGLGVINGSQAFTGVGALAVFDAELLAKNTLIASAMTIDCLQSAFTAFDPAVHKVRGFKGQQLVAAAIRRLTRGSQIIPDNKGKVQDAYSLRCTPQITGPSLDAIQYVRSQIETEMNAVADNPLFFTKEQQYKAAGNFHGQPCAMALDFLAIAVSEFASLSERHTNRLLNPNLSGGLPDFLVEGKGLNSGMMVAQYTQAALASENKVLSHPAVVDSISVSADQEDHVSMGPIAARKVTEIIRNTETVIGIEMMCAAQAMDFKKPLKPGKGSQVAYAEIRRHVKRLIDDRPLHPDIKAMTALVRSGQIVNAVEDEVGPLKIS
jgi:histidine ammonia-lyase